jgi:N-acyl-D-aspartate/D-glutamate deacylase
MSDLTLVIRNARIVDGSGAPAFMGDVGVAGDRIVAVGQVDGRGATEVDAGGKVLAPGFIDVHTHYDPQLCWDRLATPTPEHGVTSLIMGNCSISLAPVKPEQRMKVIHMFGSVEDMEGQLLEQTVPFSWQTFAEYLDYLKPELGPNVGVFVGHSVLRYYVMGAASQERTATDAEIALMCAELRSALRAGAFGLSYSFGHFDEQGQQLPCHYADRREHMAFLQVMQEEGRGMVEVTPKLLDLTVGLPQIDAFGEMALATGITCTISPILQSTSQPDMWRTLLDRFEYWQARGAPLFAQTQVRPLDLTVQLSQGSTALSKMPSWRRLFNLSVAERIEQFGRAAVRQQLEAELPAIGRTLDSFVVKRSHSAANQALLGRRVTDIAREQQRTFTDTFLDIALADGLETEFSQLGLAHVDVDVVSFLLDHPGIHIGSADAGAHITQFSGAGDTCYLLQKFVREEGRMTLERAVQRLTADLARGWRIADRGEIAVGKFADLVIFDPATIARGDEVWVTDVPGGSGRYVRRPQGIDKVFVNGALLVDNGHYTSARVGRII